MMVVDQLGTAPVLKDDYTAPVLEDDDTTPDVEDYYIVPVLEAEYILIQDHLQGDILAGDGIKKLLQALEEVAQHPEKLDKEREQFANLPKARRSVPTIPFGPPETRNQRLRRKQSEKLEERQRMLKNERAASYAIQQFYSASVKEKWRLPAIDGAYQDPTGKRSRYSLIQEAAEKNVKACWIEQGIWNSKWDKLGKMPDIHETGGRESEYRWKHEEPLEPDSESGTERGAESETERPKSRRSKSVDKRVLREYKREASRPLNQFIHQISKRRKWIEEQARLENEASVSAADINTRAYEDVKKTWREAGIWNLRWGILPGMSWKHEEPLDEEQDPVSRTVKVMDTYTGEFQAEPSMQEPAFGPMPTPYHSRPYRPGVVIIERVGSSFAMNSTTTDNGNGERTSSASEETLCQITDQALRPNKRKSSLEDGHTQPVASVLVGPIHSSEGLAAKRKKQIRPQQGPDSSNTAPNGTSPLLSKPNAAETVAQPTVITLRRSKRIQQQRNNEAKKPAPTNSLKGIARTKPGPHVQRGSTPIRSAKSRGVSKKQHTSKRGGTGKVQS